MNLAETIKQISQKKEYISERALKAKEEYDRIKEEGTRETQEKVPNGLLRRSLNATPAGETGVKGDEAPFVNEQTFWSAIKINHKLIKPSPENKIEQKIPTEIIQPNYPSEIKDFNESISILNDILKSTKVDELAYLLSNPVQLFILNFFIGLVRGISFAIGFLFVVLALGYVFIVNIHPSYVRLILEKLF